MEHIATPKVRHIVTLGILINLHAQVENVQLLDNLNTRNSSSGTLYITTTHLIFVSPEVSLKCEEVIMWVIQSKLMRPWLHSAKSSGAYNTFKLNACVVCVSSEFAFDPNWNLS